MHCHALPGNGDPDRRPGPALVLTADVVAARFERLHERVEDAASPVDARAADGDRQRRRPVGSEQSLLVRFRFPERLRCGLDERVGDPEDCRHRDLERRRRQSMLRAEGRFDHDPQSVGSLGAGSAGWVTGLPCASFAQ